MFLEKIKDLKDLKKMTVLELKQLAQEMREVLIKRVHETGGHYGPNLGMVEATIAMHYVFNSPVDKFVFDISHQTYPHKMLTGRLEGYTDPAKYKSISGYADPNESEHDFFRTGHTAAGISFAVGLAKARDVKGDNENIIAIVGDGAMSGGEAFEGLNNISLLDGQFILLFNDNDMSIAPNYGGMYQNFKKLRETKGKYENNFFIAFDLEYVYVDGHDLESLIRLFTELKDSGRRVVVHMETLKGKGDEQAETNKEWGHYIMADGFSWGDEESINQATTNFLIEKAKTDNVVVITAGTPMATGLSKDARVALGKKYWDSGIAEEHSAAMISGMAHNGVKPVWEVWSPFVQRTYDQLQQDLALNNNAGTVLVFGAYINGGEATHTAMFDIAMLRNIPNVIGLAPINTNEYLAMLNWALDQKDAPVVIRVPLENNRVAKKYVFNAKKLGKSTVEVKGDTVAILALGSWFDKGRKVARLLRAKGINPTIINPVSFNTLDTELLDSLHADHKVVITLEDGVLEGGWGQSVASYYGPSKMKVINFAAKRDFYDYKSADEIYTINGLQNEQIAAKTLEVLDSCGCSKSEK